MRDNARARPTRLQPEVLPLSGKQPTTPTTRKERRAAERRDRFDSARDERRTRAATGGSGGGSSWINTRTMTIAGVAIGLVIVAYVAINQLGGRVSGKLVDPDFAYQAAVIDGSNLGSADAPVTLEVWEDYQCPVCARHSLEVEPSIVAKYVNDGQVRIVHHDISFIGGFVGKAVDDPANESTIAGRGAYCAAQQDLYWPYSHWIYSNQAGENKGGFSRERVTQIAVAAGVEEAAFTACMDTPEAMAHVVDSTQASTDLSVTSTPTLRIDGGELMPGLMTVQELSQKLDAAIAAAPSASATP